MYIMGFVVFQSSEICHHCCGGVQDSNPKMVNSTYFPKNTMGRVSLTAHDSKLNPKWWDKVVKLKQGV